MINETGGIVGCLGMGLVVLVLVVALVLGVGALASSMMNSAAAADRAEATLERARADRDRILEEAKTERERIIAQAKVELEQVRGENWEHRYMLWTSFIEANDDDAPLILGAIFAAVLIFGGIVAGWTLANKARAVIP